MRVAIHQAPGVPLDMAANLRELENVAAVAAGEEAGLLVLPELWLTGYNIGRSIRDLAQHAGGPAAEQVGAIARQHGLGILYGYPEREGGRVFNAACLSGPDGSLITNMRKAHLFGEQERRWFMPGDTGLPVVDFGGLRVGILICYDVEFPEAVRCLALQGADLIVVPTALFEPYAFIATHVIPVRAWENHLFIAYANRCGREGDLSYVGDSQICAPDGSVLVHAGAESALLVADIHPSEFRKSAATDNPYLRDRRAALYAALCEQDSFGIHD